MSKPILCVDFDGVIHSYMSGWQGAHVVKDPPVPGAMDFLMRATKHFSVHVFSSRSSQPGGLTAMIEYISMHAGRDFAHNSLHWPMEKPAAMVTIDDRAITFTGTWPSIESLLSFQPWNKKGKTP